MVITAPPVFPVAKEIVQLQAAVAQLQSDLRDMRSAMDERMGMLRGMVQQSNDSVIKLNTAIESAQRSIQNSVAAQGAKVDSVTGNVQAVHDSLEDLRVRVAKLSEQMTQMRTALEVMQTAQQQTAQPATPAIGTPGQPAGTPAAPPPETLYQNALRDLQGGNLDIAMSGFQDYIKYYPETDLAANAQFYIGEILYRKGNAREAIGAYDAVLERYPNGNKTPAAHLKKAMALLQLKDRPAAEREFRELIRRFPTSDEAKIAQEQMKALRSSTRGAATPPRPAPRKARRR